MLEMLQSVWHNAWEKLVFMEGHGFTICEEAMKLMYQMQEEGFHVDDFVLSTVLTSYGASETFNEKS